MDMTAITDKTVELVKKYRYVLFILLIGIVFMLWPENDKAVDEPAATVAEQPQADQSDALSQILSQIHGAGKVKVLLTTAASETAVYQTDQDSTTSSESNSNRIETVIITDENRAEVGLVQRTLAPEYRGAVIVCEGADDPQVRLSIVEAVSKVTGLGTDRISVLKMK